MSEPYATRRELDILRQDAEREHAKLWARIESMDMTGTRGTAALAVRIDNLIGDLSELKTSQAATAAAVDVRLQQHQLQHQNDATRRQDGNRWRITAAIAAAATAATIIGLLVDLLARIH